MKKDDKEHISIWASRPEVWDLEPQRVKLKYGAEVDKARKLLAGKADKPKTEGKPSKKKAKS